jgi:hypothetical protein
MEFVPTDRGVPVREASTANLLIDSIDRLFNKPGPSPTASAADFTITKNQSVLNGFFTRLAVTEVVLDWCIPNVAAEFGNVSLEYVVGSQSYTSPPLADGHYTIARILSDLTAVLNAQAISEGLPLTWSVSGDVPTNGFATLNAVSSPPGTSVIFIGNNLQAQLNIRKQVAGNFFPIGCPALLPYTYLDFTCEQLTYNQDLKDETTNNAGRNTLYRWVLAWDTPSPVDTLGYPIFQGYEPFRARRYLSFPKQIRWEPNQPLGQMIFQVIGSDGEIIPVAAVEGNMEWNMCLQVSEV